MTEKESSSQIITHSFPGMAGEENGSLVTTILPLVCPVCVPRLWKNEGSTLRRVPGVIGANFDSDWARVEDRADGLVVAPSKKPVMVKGV